MAVSERAGGDAPRARAGRPGRARFGSRTPASAACSSTPRGEVLGEGCAPRRRHAARRGRRPERERRRRAPAAPPRSSRSSPATTPVGPAVRRGADRRRRRAGSCTPQPTRTRRPPGAPPRLRAAGVDVEGGVLRRARPSAATALGPSRSSSGRPFVTWKLAAIARRPRSRPRTAPAAGSRGPEARRRRPRAARRGRRRPRRHRHRAGRRPPPDRARRRRRAARDGSRCASSRPARPARRAPELLDETAETSAASPPHDPQPCSTRCSTATSSTSCSRVVRRSPVRSSGHGLVDRVVAVRRARPARCRVCRRSATLGIDTLADAFRLRIDEASPGSATTSTGHHGLARERSS